jgi:hypothetical protein
MHTTTPVTARNAQDAFEYVDHALLSGFSYASPAEKAPHLAYLITAVNRRKLKGSVGFASRGQCTSDNAEALALGRILAQGDDKAELFQFNRTSDYKTGQALARLLVGGGTFLHSEGSDRRTPNRSVALEAVTSRDGTSEVRILGVASSVPVADVIVTAEIGPDVELGFDIARYFLTITLDGQPFGGGQTPLVGRAKAYRTEIVTALRSMYNVGQALGAAHPMTQNRLNHDWMPELLRALSWVTVAPGQSAAALISDRLGEAGRAA